MSVQPDIFSLDRTGVGVVAESLENGSFKALFFEPRNANKSVRAQVKALRGIVAKLESSVSELKLGQEVERGTYFQRAVQDWHNTVHIDRARLVTAPNIDSALETLSSAYLSRQAGTGNRHNVTHVRQEVRQAYSASELISPHFFESPLVDAVGEPRKFDFGVTHEHDRMLEISSSFSFARQASADVLDAVEAWTWRIDSIRSKGGLAFIGDKELEILDDARVVAFIFPPSTPEQQKLYISATTSWRDLGIDMVEISQVESHAKELERLIA
ncbi:hypothetical protein NQ023_07970 [Corynebacterium phoceense]|uniref:hypothetical protein n=1 Tax=Corynebacterium phoceense TaxID=1686286 RepID=UPI00211CCCE2|nr:hypothetical protein [Corynebacterium phoceense]MCQ9330403.1 hypothetical protein [Corynebacterium phoceense]MCQ9348402.1 hypothetical protein [Corynebacterium phoceense]